MIGNSKSKYNFDLIYQWTKNEDKIISVKDINEIPLVCIINDQLYFLQNYQFQNYQIYETFTFQNQNHSIQLNSNDVKISKKKFYIITVGDWILKLQQNAKDTLEENVKNEKQRKQMIFEKIYELVQEIQPTRAAQITWKLLELDERELQRMLDSPSDLLVYVNQAMDKMIDMRQQLMNGMRQQNKRTNYPSSRTNYPSSRTNYPSSRTNYPSSRTNYPSSRTNYPS
jgi:hypothetical protein